MLNTRSLSSRDGLRKPCGCSMYTSEMTSALRDVVTVMPRITGECSTVVEAVCSIVFITLVVESG